MFWQHIGMLAAHWQHIRSWISHIKVKITFAKYRFLLSNLFVDNNFSCVCPIFAIFHQYLDQAKCTSHKVKVTIAVNISQRWHFVYKHFASFQCEPEQLDQISIPTLVMSIHMRVTGREKIAARRTRTRTSWLRGKHSYHVAIKAGLYWEAVQVC